MILKVLLVAIVLVAIAFAGFAVKMFFSRTAEFKKSCSSIDPNTGRRMGCTCGSGDGGENCDNRSEKFRAIDVKELS